MASRVYDLLPLAGQATQVSVQPLDFKFPISDDGLFARMRNPRGVLRWDMEIPAERFDEQAFDIGYSYIAEFDRSQSLIGITNQRQLENDYLELGAPSVSGDMGGGMEGRSGGMFNP